MLAEQTLPTSTMEIDWSPRGHFQLHLYRVIAQLIQNLYRVMLAEALEGVLTDYPFLHLYRAQLESLPVGTLLADFAERYEGHLPIRALQEELAITDQELDLLLAAGLLEEDLRFGALFAALQHPLNSRQPCLGMLDWLLVPATGHPATSWQAAQTLADHGLLEIKKGEDSVRLEWTLKAPVALWDALKGERSAKPDAQIQRQASAAFPPLDQLILSAEIADAAKRLPALFEQQTVATVVLRGMTGTGRRTLFGAIAQSLGRDLLLYDATAAADGKPQANQLRLLGPLTTLTHAMPVIRLRATAGETVTLDRLPGYSGTLGVTFGRLGGLDGQAVHHALTLTLSPPDAAQRLAFWRSTALPMLHADTQSVTNRLLLTGGRIHQVATLAHNQMALAGRTTATVDDMRTAMQSANRQSLETLATPLMPVDGWATVVVQPRVAAELEVLEARCLGRELLQSQVGTAFTNNLNRGVRALFTGPSGTGKTLAARALAGALKMDIYRVDLAGVVNKYIGETEKNLDRVFTQAEELDIILLLDEGDSLMTQRTDVKGSNDRYANLETNFLLQRLENYEGIILITTNAAQRIDQAFVRRIDVVIDFALPEAEQRRTLWLLHLPGQHDVRQDFLDRVVQRCELTGGQIRNVALHAGLLAMKRQQTVGSEDLVAALQREYRKASMPYPLAADKRR